MTPIVQIILRRIARDLRLIMAAALMIGLAACSNSEEEIDAATGKRVTIEKAVRLDSYMSQEGKAKARLTAPVMFRYQLTYPDTPYMEFPKTLHVDFFDDSTQLESTLDARYAKYFENQKKVYLRDSIVAINKIKGDTLYCEDLWWDQNLEEFYTLKPVRIRTKTEIINGTGMRADKNFKNHEITGMIGSLKFRDGEL